MQKKKKRKKKCSLSESVTSHLFTSHTLNAKLNDGIFPFRCVYLCIYDDNINCKITNWFQIQSCLFYYFKEL